MFQIGAPGLEHRLWAGDLHPAFEAHLAKYRKLVPGLALIIHLAEAGTGPIKDYSVRRAIDWAGYLESHARRLYGGVTAPELVAAKAILKKIRAGALPGVFLSWQVWRPGWTGLTDREVVSDALDLLADYGWLKIHRVETGGRPSIEYEVIGAMKN